MNVSAIELNAGLICAAVPVAFVLFKGAFLQPWGAVRTYMQKLWSRSRSSGGGRRRRPDRYAPSEQHLDRRLGNEHKKESHSSTSRFGLPKVPRGVMTGLRTFVRGGKGRVGKDTEAQTEMTAYSTYDEIGSVEEEYHRQLRGAELHGRRGLP